MEIILLLNGYNKQRFCFIVYVSILFMQIKKQHKNMYLNLYK